MYNIDFSKIFYLKIIFRKRKTSPTFKFIELYSLIRNISILNYAFERLKIYFNFNEFFNLEKELVILSKSIKNETYLPKPVKGGILTKVGATCFIVRHPSFLDKIIQEVFRIVLSLIWEVKFNNQSLGFRRSLGCHNALYFLKNKFNHINY